MSPYQALETVSIVVRNYRGTFEEHAHLAECLNVLINVLKSNDLWEEPKAEEQAHA
jgi:hypothetical protein